jgi:biopolymer transport protein ExbD
VRVPRRDGRGALSCDAERGRSGRHRPATDPVPLSTATDVDRTSVDLPRSKGRVGAERDAAIVVLAAEVDASGFERLVHAFSDGRSAPKPVSGTRDIERKALALTAGDRDRQFVIEADATVHYEEVDELLDALRRGGVRRVLLLTRRERR